MMVQECAVLDVECFSRRLILVFVRSGPGRHPTAASSCEPDHRKIHAKSGTREYFGCRVPFRRCAGIWTATLRHLRLRIYLSCATSPDLRCGCSGRIIMVEHHVVRSLKPQRILLAVLLSLSSSSRPETTA